MQVHVFTLEIVTFFTLRCDAEMIVYINVSRLIRIYYIVIMLFKGSRRLHVLRLSSSWYDLHKFSRIVSICAHLRIRKLEVQGDG